MFVVPDAKLRGGSSRGSRIVISRSEFSLRCNVRLLFVCSPERGLYIRDREYPCLNKTTFWVLWFLSTECVYWLIDWIDRLLGESDPTSPNPRLWVCIEYVPLLSIPLKLVSSVYSFSQRLEGIAAQWRYYISGSSKEPGFSSPSDCPGSGKQAPE